MFSSRASPIISQKATSKIVIVQLLQARNLIGSSRVTGSADPYCLFHLESNEELQRSTTKQKSLSPIWNEQFTLRSKCISSDDTLIIDVIDYNHLWYNRAMGSLKIPLSEVTFGEQKWYTLDNQSKQGELLLLFTRPTKTQESESEEEEKQEEKKYQVHYNATPTTLAANLTGGESVLKVFPTYEIALAHISEVFGDFKAPWNTNYPKAQTIFGSGPSAAVIRKTISLQHLELYHGGLIRTERGILKSGEQFLNLINFGIRGGYRRMFTYAIIDGSFNFSETGANFFRDFMSKHAMHSGCKTEVRYAGEFQVRPVEIEENEKGKKIPWCLVIDNNSGTYGPSKDGLPLLKKLFETNFPDLVVEALHWEDAKLKEYKKEMDEIREKEKTEKRKVSGSYLPSFLGGRKTSS